MTIFLCGFMGSGKTTIGAKLAQRLNCDYVDMDVYIEEQAGMKIPELFSKYGEPHFRALETQAVRDLAGQEGVISCGGGAMINPENAKIAREHGYVVLLDVPFRTCYFRIADSDRPFVRNNTRQQLEKIYNDRDSVYRKHCTHAIDAAHSPAAVAEEILNALDIHTEENAT